MLNNTFTVAGVSVILVAELQNPAIINPDFLRDKGIVPAEWSLMPSVATPAFAQIVYQNGLSVIVEQNRCIFEEKGGSVPKVEYQVYECARKYADKLEYNYLALGMNWHVALVHTNPNVWLKDRFFRTGEWQNNLNPTTIAFSIPGPDSATCNFTLQMGQKPPQTDVVPPPILLGCNLDFQLKDIADKTKPKQISSILQDLKKYESFLRQELIKYFEEDLI